jgi:hypothetical protein
MFQCWAEYTFSFRPKYTAKFGLFSEYLTRNWHLKAFVPFYLLNTGFNRDARRAVVESWRVGPTKLYYPLPPLCVKLAPEAYPEGWGGSMEALMPRAL